MKFFVNDFCETVQAGIVIFGEQVDNDVLYRGIGNQPSSAYSSLYLSNFLSFHTLIMKFFVKDFCETVQARIVIFGIQIDDDMLYCGIANHPSPILVYICPSFCPSFRPSFRNSVTLFRQRFLHNLAS